MNKTKKYGIRRVAQVYDRAQPRAKWIMWEDEHGQFCETSSARSEVVKECKKLNEGPRLLGNGEYSVEFRVARYGPNGEVW